MEEVRELIESYKKRAQEELEAANLLLGSQLYAGAISRAYYACFYAMNYLLIYDGIETKTHKQLAVEFRKNYIKTGKLDRKYSRILDQLFNTRILSDYDATIELEQDKVVSLIKASEEFVSGLLSAKK
jgi:uncharacterized protein (UPF0332 family)